MIITGNRTVRDLVEHRHHSTPESTFLIWENSILTYRELNEKVNSLANGLLDMGVRRGDKVMIHLSNCPEFIYSFFAILKIGAVAVLSNIKNVFDEVCYTASHSESVFVITEQEYFDLMRKVQAINPAIRRILVADLEGSQPGATAMGPMLAQCPTELRGIDLSPDDYAAIIYTSGTTSRPKGVIYVHGNLVFAGEQASKQDMMTPKDRLLTVIPFYHNNALNHHLLPVVTIGASMVLFEKFSASHFAEQIREHNVTVVIIPGPLIRFILSTEEQPTDAQNSLRVVRAGANVLTRQEHELFSVRFNVPIVNGYGLTESVSCPLCSPLEGKRKNDSIGLPSIGFEVRIVGEDDEECGVRQLGEITVRGLGKYSVIREYYKDPEATSKALRNGWLHTGDMGFMDEEGYFYFVDRKKDMIKVGGENVAAREVETVLNQNRNVLESAVIGVPDRLGNEAIKAFVVLKEGKCTTREELRQYCSQVMAKFKVPEFIEIVDELPRTASGKIEKKVLRTMHN